MDRLKWFLLAFCLCMVKSGLVFCEDQSFTIAFMTNIGHSGSAPCDGSCKPLSLFLAANEITECSISAPNNVHYTGEVHFVHPSQVLQVYLPRSLALSGSGIEQKGIRVKCNATITLYGMNTCSCNTDGFSVIPNSHLGREYYAFTVSPTEESSQIAVVSYLDNTNVTVHLRCNGCVIVLNKTKYNHGSNISVILNEYQCLQIQSVANLAGTYIGSNNSVSVFSGNSKSGVKVQSRREHLVFHVPPIKSWGKQFVLVPTPTPDLSKISDQLFVMASTNCTSVNITCTGRNGDTIHNYTINAGNFICQDVYSGYCFIQTNASVLTVQAISQDNSPSLLPLTPIDQYSTNYSFIAPNTSEGVSFNNFFLFVIEKSAASGLMLDFQTNQSYEQVDIPGTTLKGGFFELTDDMHHVTHRCANFSGVLLGLDTHDKESYAISLGWNWKTANPVDLISTSILQSTTDQSATTSNNTCENVTTLHDCNCSRRYTPGNRTRWTAILESNITREELIKLVRDDFNRNIKPNIMINRKNVSRMVRMRTSARNTETSHTYIGLGISWIVVVPVVFALVSDLLNILRHCGCKTG